MKTDVQLIQTVTSIEQKLMLERDKEDVLCMLRTIRTKTYEAESNYRMQLALQTSSKDKIEQDYQMRLIKLDKLLDEIEETYLDG